MVWIGTTPAAVDKSMSVAIYPAGANLGATKFPTKHRKSIDRNRSNIVKTHTPRRYAPTVRHGVE